MNWVYAVYYAHELKRILQVTKRAGAHVPVLLNQVWRGLQTMQCNNRMLRMIAQVPLELDMVRFICKKRV